ncbi:substrate-binding periplasmic protein [Maridesulfovibrio sp. FT414]|uniref:substrate-binding periplasmic protein n=1 Tax=Maridesulfovibrio sp. FT414 TaxID=2979469 RepID=UPI003D80430E
MQNIFLQPSMFKRIIISSAILFLITAGTFGISTAEQPQPERIKILFGYRFPPFYTVTSKRKPSESLQGVFINILEKFQKSHPEYILEFKCLPRARISKVLKEGRADAFALSSPMFSEQEINERLIPSVPLWTLFDHLLIRKDSTINSGKPEDLLGKKIAVLHGNGYGPFDKYFENGLLEKHAVYSTTQLLEMVHKKRVDGAICNKTTLPELLARAGLPMSEFKTIEEPLYSYNLHLMVNRSRTDFLLDFNEFIKNEHLPEMK